MTYTQKAQISRNITLILLSILLLLHAYFALTGGQDPWFRLAVSTIPLASFLPGIIRRRYRSASMLCFVLLLYFIVWVQVMFSPGVSAIDVSTLIIILVLFNTAMFYSRWQQRADKLEYDG